MRSDSNVELHAQYLELNDRRAEERRRGVDGGRLEWMRRTREGECPKTKTRYFWDLEMAVPLADTVFLTDSLFERDALNTFVTNQMRRQCAGLRRACIVFVISDRILEVKNENNKKEGTRWADALRVAMDTIRVPIVLVSMSHEDYCIPYRSYPSEDYYAIGDDVRAVDNVLNHPSLVMWFAKNPCFVHPKLTAIPIGLRWHPSCIGFHCDMDVTLFHTLQPYSSQEATRRAFEGIGNRTTFLSTPIFELANTGSSMYISHRGTRQAIFSLFEEKFGKVYTAPVRVRETGYPLVEHVPLEEYIKGIQTSAIVFSPSGNGIDCHRTWEAVLLGCVAVVQSSPLNEMYRDLPILFVRDWREVTVARLREHLGRLLQHRGYRWDKLSGRYWVDLILETAVDTAAIAKAVAEKTYPLTHTH